jgi:DNA (cytosine-5)-methyltransferase 1
VHSAQDDIDGDRTMVTFGSLFTGIGGFDLGFIRSGMQCLWQVEIDTTCNRILAHHWPNVKRYEDVCNVGKENLAPVDLVCGGFPCQDISVAGRRDGLAGERSGLWWEFYRIIAELRPRWIVIENVPGLLSSGERRDMGAILGALAKLGYMGAYRVLDAKFWRVAQRRRRVFIVGHRGDGRAIEVLFERESSAWDSPPSREAKARAASGIRASFKKRGGFGVSEYQDIAGTLECEGGRHQGGPERVPMIAMQCQQEVVQPVTNGLGVRRLTPTECERLQGFPDGWTSIDGVSDNARYRMLGNAVAIPNVKWIGRRIVELHDV